MSLLSQILPGSVKSVQRGTYEAGPYYGAATANITIASVNTAKAIVNNLGSWDSSAQQCSMRLTSATNLELRGNRGGTNLTGSWEVVEFF